MIQLGIPTFRFFTRAVINCLFLLATVVCYAQPKTLSGTVSSSVDNKPLAGASVQVKGTSAITLTDASGRFSLPASDGAVLVVSFIGYNTREISIGKEATISISMVPSDGTLGDVVVVGYGTQSRKKLATAISRVSGETLNKLPVTSAGDALAGLAAGVQVQSTAGSSPGEAPVIRIRGAASLGASNEPLYVVDGFPLPNESEFAKINVSDIQSIEILKDAASAAIYGSRGANGVIVVTTRRGQAGKTNFSVTLNSGVQNVTKYIDVMNKEEYLEYAKTARGNSNLRYPDIFDTPELLPDTDWQDVIFRPAGFSKAEIRANGGTDKVRFSISGSYAAQEGVMVGTGFKIANLRANLDAQLSKNLKIGFDIAPSFTWRNVQGSPTALGPYGYSPVYTALLMPPVVPVRLENGDYGQNNVLPYTQYNFAEVAIYNPLATLELFKNKTNSFGVLNNLFLEWKPVEGLTIRTQGGLTVGSTFNSQYIPATLANSQAVFANLSTPNLGGIASSVANGRTFNWIWQNTFTYNKTIKRDHNFTALLLHSIEQYDVTTTRTAGKVGTFTNVLIDNPTASTDQIGSITYGVNGFLSYAARLSYDYKEKYLFSGSVRTDGSSKFGPDKRFGVFQSYSAGWRISQESFMDNQNVVSELKLRVSYGETGNANIGDFTWMSRMAYGNYSFNNERVAGVFQTGFLNPNLTWEKNRQFNVGLEAGFLKDRITVTIDAYNKLTEGMLFSKALPAIVGYATTFTTNTGNVRNRGLELNINSRNMVGAFRWTTNLNFGYNRSKVLDLGGVESLPARVAVTGWPNSFRIEVGKPLGNFYGFIIDGVFKNAEELASYPKWTGSGVGDYKIRDVNGDGKIDEGDRTKLGNGFAPLVFGMTNTLSYKNFDMSFILQGVAGNSIINGASRHTELWSGRFNARADMVDNYFNPAEPDRDVKYARIGPRAGFGTASNLHSNAIYDGSFIRMRNLTIGYTLPAKVLNPVSLRSARFYLTAQNLFTISNYVGYNPEVSQFGSSVYQPGVDQGTYPVARTLMLGIDIGF